MMLLGRLFCLLSVVTSAHVTWKPVLGWWTLAGAIFHEKWPVTFPSSMAKDAERFCGWASTLETAWPVWCEDGTTVRDRGESPRTPGRWWPESGSLVSEHVRRRRDPGEPAPRGYSVPVLLTLGAVSSIRLAEGRQEEF